MDNETLRLVIGGASVAILVPLLRWGWAKYSVKKTSQGASRGTNPRAGLHQ